MTIEFNLLKLDLYAYVFMGEITVANNFLAMPEFLKPIKETWNVMQIEPKNGYKVPEVPSLLDQSVPPRISPPSLRKGASAKAIRCSRYLPWSPQGPKEKVASHTPSGSPQRRL